MKDKIVAPGKRKRAVARAILQKGSGRVSINKKDYETLQRFDKLKIEEPIRIAKNILGKFDFDVEITVRGGGEKAQIEAARLALSRVLVKATNSKELENGYLKYDRNLLVADIRRKEPSKPGDSKARSKTKF